MAKKSRSLTSVHRRATATAKSSPNPNLTDAEARVPRSNDAKRPRKRSTAAAGSSAVDLRHVVENRIFDAKFDRMPSHATIIHLAEDFTISKFLEHGLSSPMYFRIFKPPGMRVPKNLTSQVVLDAAGASSRVEVIDCATQEGLTWNLGDFVSYFRGNDQKKSLRNISSQKIYNLIDLEISHTSLSDKISPPTLVQELDWATNLWPENRKVQPKMGEEPNFPKTQKYVLMSKAGSYTDFHIDFGGSSVWYHVISGKKLFFLIPPSVKNRNIFAQWVLSGQKEFLGDECDDCERLELNAGQSLVIPSGWIHAVYTMDSSIVVGGNFLHIFSAEMQLDVALLEQAIKVKKSIRYPFFGDLQWLAARHYRDVWKNCTHKVNQFELDGIKAVLEFLKNNLANFGSDCRVAMEEISKPAQLIAEVQEIISTRKVVKPGSSIVFGFGHLKCSRNQPAVAQEPKPKKIRAEHRSSNMKNQETSTPKIQSKEISTQTDPLEDCHCQTSIRPLYTFDSSTHHGVGWFPEKFAVDSIYPAIEHLISRHKNGSET